METLWDHRYAQRTQRIDSSAIRELLKLTEKPNIISFAGGLPAPEVFPVDEFSEACERVLRDYGAQALQYSTTEGYLPLREMIARHTSRYGININPENVLITSGSQQALDLLGKARLTGHILPQFEHFKKSSSFSHPQRVKGNYHHIPWSKQFRRIQLTRKRVTSGKKVNRYRSNYSERGP